jgi:GTP-binding protein EngB required for normal cell division
LNEYHKHHLQVTFRYLDRRLSDAWRILAGARSDSPFQEYLPDASPVQSKVLEDYLVRLRQTMARVLQDLDVPLPPPRTAALWAFRTEIASAEIAVDEIEAKAMRGYGPLSGEDCRELEGVVAEINGLLRKMREVAVGRDEDLGARLQRLGETRDEARLLQELQRVIIGHGLVEFRQALSLLTERLESTSFEVAVFGRVSSGKSSLLNRILDQSVLPVGVTPVTAVPVRITFGEPPSAHVDFADRPSLTVPLSRLAEFATEQENPANRKHVARIRVELDRPRLRTGVTFVDTPGLGSLATSGAAETWAYLPRCDLGIVLVDAAASLAREDLEVVRALGQRGASAMLLLSKADLLTPEERERVGDYVEKHFLSDVGIRLPVHPVSVVGSEGRLADEWFEKELLPLCLEQRAQAELALRRKAGSLREEVIAALRVRLESESGGPAPEQTSRWRDAEQGLKKAAASIEKASRRSEDLADGLYSCSERILEDAALAIAGLFRQGPVLPHAPREAFEVVWTRATSEVAARLAQHLANLGDELSKALQAASAAASLPDEGVPLPRLAGMPVVDPSWMSRSLVLSEPGFRFLGLGFLRGRVVKELKAQIEPALEEALRLYRRELAAWSRKALAELRDAFEAGADACRARAGLRVGAERAASAEDRAALERDLDRLVAWDHLMEETVEHDVKTEPSLFAPEEH